MRLLINYSTAIAAILLGFTVKCLSYAPPTPRGSACRRAKVYSAPTLRNPSDVIGVGGSQAALLTNAGYTKPASSVRTAHHDVYFWPSLTDAELATIRSAFEQIHRRTCIRFRELDYRPWYHADRWRESAPYVVIRKSRKFSGYTDNLIEGVVQRSLVYLSESALHAKVANTSRGMVMDQLLRFMGYREEYLRPDAPSYIQPTDAARVDPASLFNRPSPVFVGHQLDWPFDPESVTMPPRARDEYQLTVYCKARERKDIGAGQRVGLLTRWDAVKLNSMFCPAEVGYADPRTGPCVVPRGAGVQAARRNLVIRDT